MTHSILGPPSNKIAKPSAKVAGRQLHSALRANDHETSESEEFSLGA
jgi:hypothetical protein